MLILRLGQEPSKGDLEHSVVLDGDEAVTDHLLRQKDPGTHLNDFPLAKSGMMGTLWQ